MEEVWQGKREDQNGGGSERWNAAVRNISEMTATVNSLQNLLLKKAVYADEDAFAQASANSIQTRNALALERRVKTLEKELDAAISASVHARTEKRQAEAAQRTAEARTQEVLKELENTSKVFEIHTEELRAKQEEIAKKDGEIKVLQAIIQTLTSNAPSRKPDHK